MSKKLFQCTSTGTEFQFNGKLYEQIDKVAMKSPIAPLFADFCMNWVFNQILYNTAKLKIINRYVDDIFRIFKDCTELDYYFDAISNICINIAKIFFQGRS